MHFKTPHSRQKAGYVSTVGAALFITGAFLLTSGIFTRAYSQERKPKGGDTVLLMQSDSTFKQPIARKDTANILGAIPKLRTPDNYYPFPEYLTDSSFRNKDSNFYLCRELWAQTEGKMLPFEMREEEWKPLSNAKKAKLTKRWNDKDMEIKIAFLEGKPPSEVSLKSFSPEQIQNYKKDWENFKASVKDFYKPMEHRTPP